MERRKWLAVKEYNAQRPAYYEDHAKPAWVSVPVMAVAAAALLIGGHFLSRRGGADSPTLACIFSSFKGLHLIAGDVDIGRRTGGDGGDQGGPATSDRNTTEPPRSNLPLNLAQLRAKRAEAAEARLSKEGSSNASSSLTPLGSILMLARKVSMVNLVGMA